MKKCLLFIAGLTLSVSLLHAQSLQNQRKTLLFVNTWSHCADSYTAWSEGLFDTLASIQNTTAFPAYMLQYDPGPSFSMTDLVWSNAAYFTGNNSPAFPGQPSFAVNDAGVGITEIGYTRFNASGTGYIYSEVVDTLYNYVHQFASAPSVVSVGFDKTMVTADSVVIKTKTRFNINDAGTYSVAAYAVQDGAMGWQAQYVGAGTNFPHRSMIRGDVQYGVWGVTIVDNTNAKAGDEFSQDFTCKMPSTWDGAKMHFLVVVYKWNTTDSRKEVVNVTDGNFTNLPTSVAAIANKDMSNNMSVFPMPAKSYVNVTMQTDKVLNNSTVSLYDVTGKQIAQLYSGTVLPGTPLTLQLPAHLAAGNYMLQLYNEHTSAVKQIVVE